MQVMPKQASRQNQTSISPKSSENPVDENQYVHTWRGYRSDWLPHNIILAPTKTPFPLSGLILNQFADILIGASGKLANHSHEASLEVWKLWHDLVSF